MDLFLVEARLTTSPYGGPTRTETITRLVRASSAEEAVAKLQSHYERQSSEYAVNYYLLGTSVSGVIE